MTLEEMLHSRKDMLTPADVSEVLKMHPQNISYYAKEGSLPFPFIRSGNRTKIPRIGFLKWGGWMDSGSEKDCGNQNG